MAWNDNLLPGSPAHQIAISAHGRIRVLAGPGTGKSFALKRRVARLIEVDQVNPARILAVTFTRVAAEDIHRELISLQVPGASNLKGKTLHSLAMSILMRNHVLLVLGRKPRPLNDFELEPLLADLSRVHGNKHNRRRLIRAYGAAWARLQTEQPGFARTPEDQAFADELVNWLVMHEAMLMDEVIPHLLQYLRGNPGAPELSEYSHLLIDEFQDLNRAEQDALQLLGQNGSICIIGDDDQSIYSFRHAHPEGIRQWSTLQPTEEHVIDECFRCPTTVVRMANALIARNAGRLGGAMQERTANGPGEVVVSQYRTAEEEMAAVANKIDTLIQAGVAPREIIVLAQRRTFASPIFDALRASQIPTKSYYAESALDTIEAQERFAILKLFLKNGDRVALRWLLGYGRNDWHTNAYRRMLAEVRTSGTSPWETLQALSSGEISIPYTNSLLTRFQAICGELAALDGAADLDQFLQLWLPQPAEFELLTEAINSCRQDAETPKELYQLLYEVITQPEVPLEVAEVRVMSLHKSKGLSAQYVFIVGCVEGLMPAPLGDNFSLEEREAKLQEDRRLFYVGITRVKSDLPNRPGYLALTYPQTMLAADAFRSQIRPVRTLQGTAYLQPSRFFTEMLPHVPTAELNAAL